MAMRSGARASWSATSRSRCCCPTCSFSSEARCLGADDRRLRGRPAATSSRSSRCRTTRRSIYGIVGVGKAHGRGFPHHRHGGEAQAGTAPSNLHHLRPLHPAARDLRDSCRAGKRGAGGEIQITDAMLALLKRQPFYAVKFEGRSSTAAPRSASSPPMSLTRSPAPTSPRLSRPKSRSWSSCAVQQGGRAFFGVNTYAPMRRTAWTVAC